MATALDQLLGYGKDFAQGASNAIAGNVSAPVDGIAWLMRKAGLDVGALDGAANRNALQILERNGQALK